MTMPAKTYDMAFRLPAVLEPYRDYRRWVNWGETVNPRSNPKQPRTPASLSRVHRAGALGPARNNEPETWRTFEEAAGSAEKFGCGIGLALGPADDDFDLVALDLDKCRDPETGELAPWAQATVEEHQSYTEVTPSGTGLRIIGRGAREELNTDIPQPAGGVLEVFSQSNCYVTVSGNQLPGTPDTLADLGDAVANIIRDKVQAPAEPVAPVERPASNVTDTLAHNLANMWSPGKWHEGMRFATASMVSRGMSDDAIQEIMSHYTMPGYSHEQTQKEVQAAIDGARKKGFDQGALRSGTALKYVPVDFDPFAIDETFDAGSIPRRPWQVRRLLMLGQVTLLVSPGGVAKSTFAIHVGVATALGRGDMIPGYSLVEQGNVLVLNSEDDTDEMKRRLAGVLTHYEIAPADLTGKLFFSSMFGKFPQLAHYDAKSGQTTESELLDELCAFVKEKNIKVVVIDPLVGFHDAPENDNGAMEKVAMYLRKIARETDAAVLVAHHTRKTNGDAESHAGDMDTGRGASALVSAARIAITLARMSHKTADKFQIPWNMGRHLRRIDDAKQNYAPSAEDTTWFEMRDTTIANGERVPVPVAFNMDDVKERVEALAEVVKRQEKQNRVEEVIQTISEGTTEGVIRNADAVTRYIGATGKSRSTANAHLKHIPEGRENAFRHRNGQLWWREPSETEVNQMVIRWVSDAPELPQFGGPDNA
jgi:RecA-family ATPase